MSCDQVQETLSAFLDHEESVEEIENALSHLYGCKDCQRFFNAAIGLRNIAKESQEPFPSELDEAIMMRVNSRVRARLFNYRLRFPAYVVSAAAVILVAVSFTFGFMFQENVHQKEMNAILQAPPSSIVYAMPTQLIYPAAINQRLGEKK